MESLVVIAVMSTLNWASVTVVPSMTKEPETSPVRPTASVADPGELLVDAEAGERAGRRVEVEIARRGVDVPGAVESAGAGCGAGAGGVRGDAARGGVDVHLVGGVAAAEPPQHGAEDEEGDEAAG